MPRSYYEWIYGTSSLCTAVSATVEDAQVMREHPDGTPCYAKKMENCPIFGKEIKNENADDLSASVDKEKRHLFEIFSKTLNQIREKVPEFESMSYSELENAYEDMIEEMSNVSSVGVEIKNARSIRDAVFKKHPDALYQSFNLSDGEETHPDGGWGVTFHTTSAETSMDSEEYDRNVALFSRIFKAKPQVGVYEGSCEISYECKSLPVAIAGMIACEQKAIFGYMMQKNGKDFGIDILNFSFDRNVNNLEYAQE